MLEILSTRVAEKVIGIRFYMRFVHPLIDQIESIKTKANIIISDIFDPYTIKIVKNKVTKNA